MTRSAHWRPVMAVLLPVRLAPACDPQREHDQLAFLEGVHNAVVTDADPPPSTLPATEHHRTGRPRVYGQQLDCP